MDTSSDKYLFVFDHYSFSLSFLIKYIFKQIQVAFINRYAYINLIILSLFLFIMIV
jgi:hypothetical protein